MDTFVNKNYDKKLEKKFHKNVFKRGVKTTWNYLNSPRSKTLGKTFFSIFWKKFLISFLFKNWRFFKLWTFITLKRLDWQVWNFRIWLNAWSWVTLVKKEVSEKKWPKCKFCSFYPDKVTLNIGISAAVCGSELKF